MHFLKNSSRSAARMLGLSLTLAVVGPLAAGDPPHPAAPAAPAGADAPAAPAGVAPPAAPAYADPEKRAMILSTTPLPEALADIVMAYDPPLARYCLAGLRAAGDAPWQLDVKVYDHLSYDAWLGTLSAARRAQVETNGQGLLYERIAHTPEATILDLKLLLGRKYGVPPGSVRLMSCGKLLADDCNVQGLGMEQLGALNCVIRR